MQSTPTPTFDASTDRSQSPEHHAVKKRKPTYLIRKEEEKALRDEVLKLEAQVASLQTERIPVAASMQQVAAESKVLREVTRNQQLGVAAAQSLVLECAWTQYSHPLWSRISLKKDWDERRATLITMREAKLQTAYNYAMTRNQHTVDSRDQESQETFETDEGDVCCTGNVVIHFPGVESLEQVFNALCFYLNNMEISISERLGHITIREDYDVIEGSACNSRIISSDSNGVSTESNTIVFTQLFAKGDPRFGGEPCAVVTSDCVDEDELYPYHGDERIRKDISGAIVLTASRQQDKTELAGGTESIQIGSDGLVVVMRRSGMLKLHCPEFPLSPFAQQELEEGIADWVTLELQFWVDRPPISITTAQVADEGVCLRPFATTMSDQRTQFSHPLCSRNTVILMQFIGENDPRIALHHCHRRQVHLRSDTVLTVSRQKINGPVQAPQLLHSRCPTTQPPVGRRHSRRPRSASPRTSCARKRNSLKDEILQLHPQVAVLKTQGMPTGSAIAADPSLQESTAKWKVLTNTIKNQQLGVAEAQSLAMECTRTQYSHPLHSRIRLKKNWGERRATLVAIREDKLKTAYDYVMARSRYAANMRFPGVQSLEQVFEALCFYLTNMEISISERLGHITVREAFDMIEGSAYNARIVSSDDNGISTESNTIVFMQLIREDDLRFGGEPCVVVASDCVDEDELYAYRPSEYIRKDISGAIVMAASREQKPNSEAEESGGNESGELVVTMRRTGYLKLHRPAFPVSPLARQELEAGIADWGTVMIKAMREILYTHGRDDCRLSLAQTNQLDLFPFAGREKDSER
ncbi:hypothetical protein PI126_g5676 [Phytophthora idaei]|nr:hypothetical protein PI126_g5676 [Phytophthora idaei]